MSLFPFIDVEEVKGNEDLKNDEAIPREYEFDFGNNRLTGRIVEGNEALKIWILKTLKTPRYKHIIYTWDYGVEIEDLISSSYDRGFIESEVARGIEEALTINPHITGIKEFTTSFNQDHMTCDFTVITTYGEVKINELHANI